MFLAVWSVCCFSCRDCSFGHLPNPLCWKTVVANVIPVASTWSLGVSRLHQLASSTSVLVCASSSWYHVVAHGLRRHRLKARSPSQSRGCVAPDWSKRSCWRCSLCRQCCRCRCRFPSIVQFGFVLFDAVGFLIVVGFFRLLFARG